MLARLSLSEEPCRGTSVGTIWASILEEYTRLDLTFEKDRLPALSGIAKLIESFEPGRYIAGLWEKDLLYQLLWEIRGASGMDTYMPKTGGLKNQRANIYSPTFSWTSWIEQVQYYCCDRGHISMSLCEVVEIQSVVSGLNKYGEVSYAHVKLRGELVLAEPLRFRITLLKKVRDEAFQRKQSQPDWAQNAGHPRMCLDYNVDDCWDELFFLKVMCISRDQAHMDCSGLILRQTEISDTFTRVGVATIAKSWVGPGNCLVEVKII